jgi:D-glucuronyl C5-epimerase-like protein
MERPEAADRHEPSTSDRCRNGRIVALALGGALALLCATGQATDARQTRSVDSSRTQRAKTAPSAHRASTKHPPRVTVASTLTQLLHAGSIDRSAYWSYRSAWNQASSSLRKLSGTRHEELGAVASNLEAMASNGRLSASRLPQAFLTLRANREWWTAKPLLGADERVSLPGSRLVWEHYPGQGIEIQWLATFGEANSYYDSRQTAALEQVLSEAISLASSRAGGISWDYMFVFDGGRPPWTSALSQGTALQALARAWSATKEQRYQTAAQQALGIFKAAPPEGVLAPASGPSAVPGPGRWYLQYSYAPSEHILNGFIQSLVGLYDYTRLTGDPLGEQLFEAGDAQARAQVSRFDTGAWSKYDQSSESDLSYHDLLTEFLEHLCQRTREGEPLSGGQIAGDEIYCTTASHFQADLKTPPAVKLLTSSVNTRERAGVQIALSKVSTVSMTISFGGKTVWTNTITVEGGKPRLLWVVPSKAGAYTVSLHATDLAGNRASASGTIAVKTAPRHPGHSRGKVAADRGHASSAAADGLGAQSERISPPARRLPNL